MIPTPNRELRKLNLLLTEQVQLLKDMKKELEFINTNTKPPEVEV